jgi:hypothetical protein
LNINRAPTNARGRRGKSCDQLIHSLPITIESSAASVHPNPVLIGLAGDLQIISKCTFWKGLVDITATHNFTAVICTNIFDKIIDFFACKLFSRPCKTPATRMNAGDLG